MAHRFFLHLWRSKLSSMLDPSGGGLTVHQLSSSLDPSGGVLSAHQVIGRSYQLVGLIDPLVLLVVAFTTKLSIFA